MSRVEDISQEIAELESLISSKAQTDKQIDMYQNILKFNSELFDSIQVRLSVGYVKQKSYVLGFIPIVSKIPLDVLDVSRLKLEMEDIKDTVYNNKQYFEQWLTRRKEYEQRMDEITRECNSSFDEAMKRAKEITYNPRLVDAIKNYGSKDNSQEDKNVFYLYLKKEINSADIHKSKNNKNNKNLRKA